jgi:predicted ABC-type ATPase
LGHLLTVDGLRPDPLKSNIGNGDADAIETKLNWNEKEKVAFEALKRSLANAPILCHLNLDYPFIIETVASLKGLVAVLVQSYSDLVFNSS